MVLKLRDFRLIVEHASDAIMVTEAAPYRAPGPKIVYVNQAFCQLCGYEKSEILGRNPRFLQGPQTDQAMLHDIRRAGAGASATDATAQLSQVRAQLLGGNEHHAVA
jgi:PAS domain S-box-containing protein